MKKLAKGKEKKPESPDSQESGKVDDVTQPRPGLFFQVPATAVQNGSSSGLSVWPPVSIFYALTGSSELQSSQDAPFSASWDLGSSSFAATAPVIQLLQHKQLQCRGPFLPSSVEVVQQVGRERGELLVGTMLAMVQRCLCFVFVVSLAAGLLPIVSPFIGGDKEGMIPMIASAQTRRDWRNKPTGVCPWQFPSICSWHRHSTVSTSTFCSQVQGKSRMQMPSNLCALTTDGQNGKSRRGDTQGQCPGTWMLGVVHQCLCGLLCAATPSRLFNGCCPQSSHIPFHRAPISTPALHSSSPKGTAGDA